MIARIWHGYTTHANAEAYAAALQAEILPGIMNMDIRAAICLNDATAKRSNSSL